MLLTWLPFKTKLRLARTRLANTSVILAAIIIIIIIIIIIVLLAAGLQKPHQKSKAKEHQEYLAKRLALWKEGEVDVLLREGRMIQKRLGKPRKADPPNKAKILFKR